jgi:hypothetical protein
MKNKHRNAFLKAITWIASINFMLSACMLDSESIWPIISTALSLFWLGFFCYANKDRIERMAKR